MTAEAVPLHDICIEIADVQHLTVGLKRERNAVIPAVDGLDEIFANHRVVRRVTVVAARDTRVNRVLPRVVLPSHHMTVVTRGRVVRKVRVPLRVHEGKQPHAQDNAEQTR
jgi:hypothetical protein